MRLAREHFDHQTENPRLLAADTDRDDDVAHTTDRFAVRAEHHQAGEPGCEYLAHCCHDCKARFVSVRICIGATEYRRAVGHDFTQPSASIGTGRSRQQPEDDRQGEGFARRRDLPRPRGRGGADGEGRRHGQPIVDALAEDGWGEQVKVVRVNDWTTEWTYADVVDGGRRRRAPIWTPFCCPRCPTRSHVQALDLLLTQVEKANGLEVGRIGIEPQIENAIGLTQHRRDRHRQSRASQTLVFGPADFMASMNMRTLVVGEQPDGYDRGDAYHHILMTILMAARAHGLQAIDGPYLQIRDVEAFRRSAARTAALGFDGKWVLHPDADRGGQRGVQSAPVRLRPAQRLIFDAYAFHTSAAGGGRGAVMLGDEMIDEASRKMALVISAKGRAAGMTRTSEFTPPEHA